TSQIGGTGDHSPAVLAFDVYHSASTSPHKGLHMRLVFALTLCAPMVIASIAQAQDIEPRAYSNAPVGVNFLIPGYAHTQGGLPLDPSLPITNPDLNTSNAVLAYARVLDLWGKSGKFDLVAPYVWLSGSADFAGRKLQRVVNGFADPLFRFSI